MTEERERMDPLKLQCITPRSIDLMLNNTIDAKHCEDISLSLVTWESIVEAILSDDDTASNHRDVAGLILRDLSEIRRALIHVAAGGDPVRVVMEFEVKATELVALIRHTADIETRTDYAASVLAEVINELLKGKDDPYCYYTPEGSGLESDDEPDDEVAERELNQFEEDTDIRMQIAMHSDRLQMLRERMEKRICAIEDRLRQRPTNGSAWQVPERETSPSPAAEGARS